MSFWTGIKDFLGEVWEASEPSFFEVFKFVLALAVIYAKQIAEGYMTKDQARDSVVKQTVAKFSTPNPGKFSRNRALMVLTFAVEWIKMHGQEMAEEAVTYKNEVDFMKWYLSHPDKQ